jgi:hypothetical protein
VGVEYERVVMDDDASHLTYINSRQLTRSDIYEGRKVMVTDRFLERVI